MAPRPCLVASVLFFAASGLTLYGGQALLGQAPVGIQRGEAGPGPAAPPRPALAAVVPPARSPAAVVPPTPAPAPAPAPAPSGADRPDRRSRAQRAGGPASAARAAGAQLATAAANRTSGKATAAGAVGRSGAAAGAGAGAIGRSGAGAAAAAGPRGGPAAAAAAAVAARGAERANGTAGSGAAEAPAAAKGAAAGHAGAAHAGATGAKGAAAAHAGAAGAAVADGGAAGAAASADGGNKSESGARGIAVNASAGLPDVFADSSPAAATVRTAILFFGTVTRLLNSAGSTLKTHDGVYNTSAAPFTPLRITAAAFRRFLIEPNSPSVDTFAHSWQPELEAEYREHLRPVLAAFESIAALASECEAVVRETGSEFSQLAWAHSAKRAFQLMVRHESAVGQQYDRVVFFRPDVMLLKEMRLPDIILDPELVYVNSGNTDFHFAMTRSVAQQFVLLPNSVSKTFPARKQEWVQAYVNRDMQTGVTLDPIVPGRDEEVYRRIPTMKRRCEEVLPALRKLGMSPCDQVDVGLRCPGDRDASGKTSKPLRSLDYTSKPWACGRDMPWWPVPMHSCRVAVVLRASYMRGDTLALANATRCPSLEGQLRATRSVVDHLIRPLEDSGIVVDVFSATYVDCKTTDRAMAKLAPWLRADIRSKRSPNGLRASSAFDASLSLAQYAWEGGVSYRSVVVLSHAIVLKADLAPLLFTCRGFCVPFKLAKSSLVLPSLVPDTIQVMRGAHLGCFLDLLAAGPWPREEMWDRVIAAGVNASDMGHLIDFYGDSDPEIYWNPLYRMDQRGEGPVAPQERRLAIDGAQVPGGQERAPAASPGPGL